MFHRKIWWFYDWLSEMRAPLKASNGLVVIFRSPAFWRRGGREDIKHFNSSEYQRIFDWTQSQNQNHQTSKESRNSPCYWWFWISDKFLYCGPLQRLKGRGQKKKRDYVGKIPNKIAEVIWEDCGGYMVSIWQLTASLNSSVFTILLDW